MFNRKTKSKMCSEKINNHVVANGSKFIFATKHLLKPIVNQITLKYWSDLPRMLFQYFIQCCKVVLGLQTL